LQCPYVEIRALQDWKNVVKERCSKYWYECFITTDNARFIKKHSKAILRFLQFTP